MPSLLPPFVIRDVLKCHRRRLCVDRATYSTCDSVRSSNWSAKAEHNFGYVVVNMSNVRKCGIKITDEVVTSVNGSAHKFKVLNTYYRIFDFMVVYVFPFCELYWFVKTFLHSKSLMRPSALPNPQQLVNKITRKQEKALASTAAKL